MGKRKTRPMPIRLIAVLCASALAAGCASFPQLDASVSADALAPGYPALVPVDGLRVAAAARAPAPGATTLLAGDPATTASPAPEIDARAARLRARAAGLRRTEVIDAAAQERLDTEIRIDEGDV